MNKNCNVRPRPRSVKEFFLSWFFWKPMLSIIIGGGIGFLYYYYVGCTSGTCAITSNPISSVAMGSLMGLFITSSPCSRC